MCLAVYIELEFKLPIVKWSDDKVNDPFVFFKHISGKDEHATSKLSLPYIYYVGTNTGCGCGFNYSEWYLEDVKFSDEDMERIRITRGNYKLLHDILSNLKKQDKAKYEVFVCWEGDQKKDIKAVQEILLDDLIDKNFYFKEMYLYKINPFQ